MSDLAQSTPPSRPIRWKLLAAILVLGIGGFVALSYVPTKSVQHTNYLRYGLLMVLLVALLLWFFVFSRLSGTTKVWGGGVLGVLILCGLSLVQVEYVDGNLTPRFIFRWNKYRPPPLEAHLSSGPALPAPPGAADFTQFFGSSRNGKIPHVKLATDWTAHPPKELWRKPLGQGWAGTAVAGGMAITLEQREEFEMVVCYELTTGNVVWSHKDTARHDDPLGGIGPRTTPAIDGGRVFTQGATGILNCLDLASGRLLWTKDILASNGSKKPEWGVSASPLVLGEWVIVCPGNPNGGSLAAYHKTDGSRVWISGSKDSGYSSPVRMNFGQDTIVYLSQQNVVGYDATSGKVLWDFPWHPQSKEPSVAAPVQLSANEFHVSSGYGRGSARVKLTRLPDGTWLHTEVWSTNRMKAKFTNLIEHNGYVYGLDDGMFACQDAATGELKWREGRYGHGQALLVGEHLLVMAETGEIALLAANPDEPKELAKYRVFEDKTWNPPCLAGKFLVVRNDREIVCLEMATVP